MQVKALLFDLGRVVIDVDFARVVASWAHAAKRDPDLVARGFADRVRDGGLIARHERGEITDAAFFDAVRIALDLDLDEAALRAGWNDIFVGEIPGMAALLRQCAARFPLYVLSNTNPAHQAVFTVRYADVLTHFRKLYLSHEMGQRKPEPEIYRMVAADLGLAPSDILFFDDHPGNVAAAKAVGMPAVVVGRLDDVAAALETIRPPAVIF